MYSECICKRCGHVWQPRIDTKPVQCPKCKSPMWSTERKRPTTPDVTGVPDASPVTVGSETVADPETTGKAISEALQSGDYKKNVSELGKPTPEAEKKLKELGVDTEISGVPPPADGADKELTTVGDADFTEGGVKIIPHYSDEKNPEIKIDPEIELPPDAPDKKRKYKNDPDADTDGDVDE